MSHYSKIVKDILFVNTLFKIEDTVIIMEE